MLGSQVCASYILGCYGYFFAQVNLSMVVIDGTDYICNRLKFWHSLFRF